MSVKKQILASIVCSLVSFQSIHGITYGSTGAVALVTANQLIAAGDPTNQIIGFSEFVGGITIPNATTVCRYNNYFPFYGPTALNGGLLNLNRNLIFGSNATLTTGAQFNGNGFSLSLPTKTSNFVISSGTVMGRLTLEVNSPLQLTSVLTFTNACILNGNNNIIDCTAGALAIGPNSSLVVVNATLKGISSNSFYCYDNTGTVQFNNVTCALNSTLTFSQGTFQLQGDTIFTGTQIFAYTSSFPIVVHSNVVWSFDSGMTFSYDTNANNLLTFEAANTTLKLYETTLYANRPGLNLTKGTVILDGACPLINDGTTSAQGISIGDGVTSANNVILNVLAESGINLTRGFFVNNNV